MRKLSLFTTLILAVAVGVSACGDDDDDGDDVADTPDADTSGTPDAAPETPDATPLASAENLGQPCGGAGSVACPGGEDCVTITGIGSQTEGFCTVPCTGEGDTVSCSNGYAGGGTPACALDDGAGGGFCAVLCNPAGSGECATGTVCTDAGGGAGVCTGDE
jgi:hypothetical protein